MLKCQLKRKKLLDYQGPLHLCFVRQKRSYSKAKSGTVNYACEWMCGHNPHAGTMHLCWGSSKSVNENEKKKNSIAFLPQYEKTYNFAFLLSGSFAYHFKKGAEGPRLCLASIVSHDFSFGS